VSIITIDFETYYDKDYSLSKMTTEEYIRDPRFEVIGMGVKWEDGPTKWYSDAAEIKAVLESCRKDWQDHAIVCHNTMFDGAILAWHYNVVPGFYFDTMLMARALHSSVEVGGSLKALASHYKVGEKGDEVINALGKHYADFSTEDLIRYGDYCRNDVDLTSRLFHILSNLLCDSEQRLIDLTLRMFIQPVLRVDDALLVQKLEEVQEVKKQMLSTLMTHLECDTEEAVRKKLASNPQFAELLRDCGVEPPTKISPATGKETYALAKTDQGFIDLQTHEDPIVQQLCAVRLGTKSTLEETRLQRFIEIGSRNRGSLPIPLKYYGAHTGRWAGMDSVNFQNLPSRDKSKKTLKNAIVAPPGHVVINSDSSQIEARVLAWFAGQLDLIQGFAQGRDVYSEFASKVFNKPVSRENPTERFVGKTCIVGLGYGTGAEKLRQTLKLGGADLTLEKCKEIVELYRRENYTIPRLWRKLDLVVSQMMATGTSHYTLPNELKLHYPNLRIVNGGTVYDSRRGIVNLWGGAMTENIVQAMARIIIGEQMLAISERYRPVLTVHDSVVIVVPEEELAEAMEFITITMSKAPVWAMGLPVTCEAKAGKTYGEC